MKEVREEAERTSGRIVCQAEGRARANVLRQDIPSVLVRELGGESGWHKMIREQGR